MKPLFRNAMGLLFLSAAGCITEADAPQHRFDVSFPSVAAAVVTDSVKVTVFDANDAQSEATLCATLVRARRTHQPLPTPIAQSESVSVCSLASQPPAISVSYGRRAFLAVGEGGGAETLIGCAVLGIGPDEPNVTIDLALFDDTTLVPFSACQTLSAACSGGC